MVDVWPIHLTELSIKLNKVFKPPQKLIFPLEITVARITIVLAECWVPRALANCCYQLISKGLLRCDEHTTDFS